MSKVPLDVITDIFHRLPVKPLVRFKCLSKPCRSLIDGQDFINLHLQRSIKTKSNYNLILKNLHLYSVELDSLDTAVVLNYPVNLAGGTEAFGSSNGLIALRSSDKDLGLYNPSTRKKFKLKFEPVESKGDYSSPGYVFYGFGYDSVTNDYKVVRMVTFNNRNDDNDNDDDDEDNVNLKFFEYEVKVYSLKNDSWRRIKILPNYLRFMFQFFYHLLHRRGYGVLVGGVLHWLMPRRPELGMDNLIVGFDLVSEEFCQVPQPNYDPLRGFDFQIDVGVLNGLLCVACNYSQMYVDVWVMKEYGVKESWCKLITVQRPKTVKNFSYFRPLAYSKDGEKILMELNNEKLVWYDVVRKKFKTVRINGAPNSFCAEVYVGSLVPLKEVDAVCKKNENKNKENKKQNGKKRDDFLSVGFKLVL